jgi:DNA-binding CsgD family transcriptional regulator
MPICFIEDLLRPGTAPTWGLEMRDVKPDELKRAYRELGETIVDPSTWPRIMEKISAAVGATGALLLQSDVRTTDVPHTESLDSLARSYFDDDWHMRDVRAERGVPLLLNGNRVVVDQDIIAYDELRSLPFYNELFIPRSFQWFAVVGFTAGPALWGLSIQRTIQEGPFEAEEARLLATLSDGLTEVATLSTAIGRVALTSATNALDLVRQPAVAIDCFGLVLDANTSAESLFDSELCIKGRRLFTSDPQAKSALQKLTERLIVTSDIDPLSTDPIVIRRKEKGPVAIRLLPVHPAARNPFLGARALLTFSSVEARPRPDPILLARIFGLTPAEARLATLVAGGLSPDDIAERFGITRTTARNQLKAVFAKTGTHRQSELVALLARL